MDVVAEYVYGIVPITVFAEVLDEKGIEYHHDLVDSADEAVDKAKEKGYRHVLLWHNYSGYGKKRYEAVMLNIEEEEIDKLLEEAEKRFYQ